MSLSNKTLLVLGASRYQLPTIEYAKSIGLKVVVTDNIPDNPGHQIADKSYFVDTTDKEAVLVIVKQEKIDAAIAPCTDVAVATAAYVNKELGNTAITLSSAETLTSKFNFRQFQRDNNLPHPEFQLISDVEVTARELDFSHSWVIKPDQSSGSKGIFIIESGQELCERYPESVNFSLNGVVSIEQCIQGHHGTAEGVISNGEINDIFYLDRQTAKAPYVCTTGHLTPSILGQQEKITILAEIKQLWACLDIDNTVFDVDYIWDGQRAIILEASPRLGGNSITQLISLSYDVNLLDLAISSALRIAPYTPNAANGLAKKQSQPRPVAVILIGVHGQGELFINDELVEKLNKKTWVYSIEFHAQAGDPVEAFINGRHCLATLFICAETYAELAQRETYIRSLNILDSK